MSIEDAKMNQIQKEVNIKEKLRKIINLDEL